jgi:capsular polysaccharide biosynthesis protein
VSAADSPAHTLRVGGATSEITLYGYPESLLEEVVQAAASLQVRSDVPAIDHLRNLTFFPKLSALYDEDGRRVLETCVRRGPGLKAVPHPAPEEVAIPSRARRVDYPVIYCGRLRAHWGHFLTESISRLWPLPDADVPADAALLFQRAKRRAAYVVDRFFSYAGVDRGRLLELDSVTKLSDVFVPHPSFALEAEAFRCHAGLPERVAEAIGDGGRPSSDQPVYLSRRLITSPGGRRIVGEEELEDLLRRRGVMIVSPETLSYEDQVRLFNRHSTFIGCVGSAFHSLLYAPSGRSRRTVVIVPNALSHYERGSCYVDYFLTDALKGTRSSYLFDPVDSDEPSAETTLNAGATAAFLERLSLI